jgi:hypothetical protein
MKKRGNRTKAKSSLKRARSKSKTRKTKSTKGRKTLLPKVKQVAKKAALAAGAAAVGTALSELQPEKRSAQRRSAPDESQSNQRK